MQSQDVKISAVKQESKYRQDMGDLEGLAQSIREKGILLPLIVNKGMRVIAGRRRLEAAKLAGLKEVPVLVRADADELDSREIELLENIRRKDLLWWERARLEQRIFELRSKKDKEWSNRKQAEFLGQTHTATNRRMELAAALESVPELKDVDNESVAWKTYQRLKEDVILQAMEKRVTEKDEARPADVRSPFLKIARDSYQIADALDALEKHKSNAMHFAEVDPPYAVQIDRRKSRNARRNIESYQEIDEREYPAFLTRAAEETFRILTNNTFCVWWFGPTHFNLVLTTLRSVGFAVSDIPAIWTKGSAGQTASPDTHLGNSYEMFFVCRKGQPKLGKPGRSNDFRFTPTAPSQKIHPTEKPLELMTEIMDTFTYTGYRVLVPFLGSGVTLRACFAKGRDGWGFDLDEVTKRRFCQLVAADVEKGLY